MGNLLKMNVKRRKMLKKNKKKLKKKVMLKLKKREKIEKIVTIMKMSLVMMFYKLNVDNYHQPVG